MRRILGLSSKTNEFEYTQIYLKNIPVPARDEQGYWRQKCNVMKTSAREKGLMTVCITLQHCTRNRALLKIVGLESRCFGSEVPGRFQCLQWLGKCILLLEDVKQHHDGNQPYNGRLGYWIFMVHTWEGGWDSGIPTMETSPCHNLCFSLDSNG